MTKGESKTTLQIQSCELERLQPSLIILISIRARVSVYANGCSSLQWPLTVSQRCPLKSCPSVTTKSSSPDVRHNFIKCFYDHLIGSGIVAFRDREEINPGERINTKIAEAIKRSDICIPVFSMDFASSATCLMEVAQMVETEKPILPIFYGVKPCVVRYRQGTYGTAFIKHEGRRDAETITKWKNALANIAGILAFELEDVDMG